MQVVGIIGPSGVGKTTTVERVLERLERTERVATVKHLTHAPEIDTSGKDTERHRSAGADVTVGIADEHGWFATGSSANLGDTLDRLAPSYDICLIEGFTEARLPAVVLGGMEYGGPVVARADVPDDLDIDQLVSDIQALEPYVTLESLVQEIKSSPRAERAGAIATFTGRVRRLDTPEDPPTDHLEFEYYEGVADDRLERIQTELADRDGVLEVLMHHRTGVIEYGEDIVFVVVLAGHRREAFETVEDGINRLKEEVPIFKKEVTVDDEFWVHDRAQQ